MNRMRHIGTAGVVCLLILAIALPASAQDDGYFDHLKSAAEGSPEAATPAATEYIALGDGIELLYYYFVQDGEDVNAYGEIRNTDSVAHRAPGIDFTFLDDAGNAYLTGSVSPTRRWIGPGERLGFQGFVIQKTLRLGDWADVMVARGWMPPENVGFYDMSDVVISGVSQEGQVVDGVILDGKLENPTAGPISIDELTIEFRDATGKFVGSCSDYVDASIPPGQFIRFSVSLYESGLCGFQAPAIDDGAKLPLTYRLLPSRF